MIHAVYPDDGIPSLATPPSLTLEDPYLSLFSSGNLSLKGSLWGQHWNFHQLLVAKQMLLLLLVHTSACLPVMPIVTSGLGGTEPVSRSALSLPPGLARSVPVPRWWLRKGDISPFPSQLALNLEFPFYTHNDLIVWW